MGSSGNYETSREESLIDKENEYYRQRTVLYVNGNTGVFFAPKKCPKCHGKLSLTRKFECYEYLICVECKRRYKRNVFKKDSDMEEFKYGSKSD